MTAEIPQTEEMESLRNPSHKSVVGYQTAIFDMILEDHYRVTATLTVPSTFTDRDARFILDGMQDRFDRYLEYIEQAKQARLNSQK